MWGRPVRQATAMVADGAGVEDAAKLSKVLVHRNEINEQQRPGSLVLVPLMYSVAKGEDPKPHWGAMLLKQMLATENGRVTSSKGLLLYSGSYIGEHGLDPHDLIHDDLKKPGVLFITNHHHTFESGKGMVSSMRGIPILRSPDGGLIDVRKSTAIDPAILEEETSSEHVELFHFGGLIMFELTKHVKPKPKAVRAMSASTHRAPPLPTALRPRRVSAATDLAADPPPRHPLRHRWSRSHHALAATPRLWMACCQQTYGASTSPPSW